MNLFSFKVSKILLYLFSIALALGTWNPFVPYQYEVEERSGLDMSQIISVLFIGSLLFVPNIRIKKNRFLKVSGVFFGVVLMSTVINSLSLMTMSTIVFFVKFALVLLLFHVLPQLFKISPKLFFWSAFLFSITCAILSICYSLGYLYSYVFISHGRVFFWGENPNSTSARYGIAFLLLLHVIVRNPLRWGGWRHILWLPLPFILNLIMATGSRGSFLTLLICILVYLAYLPFRSKGYKWLLAFCLPIGIYFAITYFAKTNQEYSLFERLTDSIERGEDADRGKLNKDAIQIFMDNPVYGVGIQHFQDEMLIRFHEIRTVHNLYLYVLAVSGIIGFGPFVMLLFYLLKSSYEIRKSSSLPLTLFIYIFLLAYKTGGILTYMLMWYVFAIIIAFSYIYKRKKCV